MTRLLFIVPPYVAFNSFVAPSFNERTIVKKTGKYGSIVTEIPIGILSISSFLKANANVEIRVIDFNTILNKMDAFDYQSFSELYRSFMSRPEWRDFAPNIIAISTLFTPAYHNMLDLADVAREIFTNSLLLAGDGVPTNMYREIFSACDSFDALCYGEGEKPMLALVQAGDRKELLRSHQSWITSETGAASKTFEHDFIGDLDDIPFLDYELLTLADYDMNPLQALFHKAKKKISMSVMTSRGCPHRCCFCSSHTVHGRKMRYHSIERIREDFTRLRDQYGADTMVFFDDHLMSDRQRVFDIIDIMKDLDLRAFFPSSLALYALDRKILEALQSIGLNQLVLSVESGSFRVLKEIMHKPLDLKIVERVIADCKDLGIASDVSILIGLPGETKQGIEDAKEFFKTLSPSWFRISMATPLVGSEMLDICQKNNYIKGDYISCDFKKAIVETEDFTAEYIQEKAYTLNLELNFLYNSDFQSGNYQSALDGFENTIRVRDDHAFAYYFAALCCQKLNLSEKFNHYSETYHNIIKESTIWQNYVSQFELEALTLPGN